MKRYILPGLIAMVFVSFDASAQCAPNTRVNNLQNLLPGKTVCATRGTDRWQEEHRVGGELWDYKRGPNDKVDPSKNLGTWSIGGPANRQVTYTYTAFGDPVSHTFEVHQVGSTYNFCGIDGASNVLDATIQDSPSCQ